MENNIPFSRYRRLATIIHTNGRRIYYAVINNIVARIDGSIGIRYIQIGNIGLIIVLIKDNIMTGVHLKFCTISKIKQIAGHIIR